MPSTAAFFLFPVLQQVKPLTDEDAKYKHLI